MEDAGVTRNNSLEDMSSVKNTVEEVNPYVNKAIPDPHSGLSGIRTNQQLNEHLMKRSRSVLGIPRNSNESSVLVSSNSVVTQPYTFNKSKPLFHYDPRCNLLKQFITDNFNDSELIDYDCLHRLYDRMKGTMSKGEIEDEIREDSQKTWEFLSKFVILRESSIKNKFQIFLEKRARDNIQTKERLKIVEA